MDDKTLSEAWLKLKGNPSVKRALMVAWAGKLSIVVAGNPDNGMQYLETIAAGLEVKYKFLKPCLCGNLYDSLKACLCPQKAIMNRKNNRSFQKALNFDMAILMCRPGERDLDSQEAPLETDMKWAKPDGEPDFSKELPIAQDARSLLTMAYDKYSLTLGSYERTLKVAKTIALMNGKDEIMGCHMAEALQYSPEILLNS